MEAVFVPQMDLTTDAVSVERWLVDVGSEVCEGDDVVEVGTDKATVVLTAPVDGRVVSLEVPVGGLARVGSTLALIEPRARL